MPDSIRDRLRRILNGNPAQRIAQTDQARRSIDARRTDETIVGATSIKPRLNPIEPARSAPIDPIAPAASTPNDVTQPVSRPKVPVSEPTVPMRPIDLPAANDPYQSPAVLRPIDHRMVGDVAEAQAFIENLREKMAALAEDFAAGHINRQQFESVYVHYREQRQMIEGLLTSMTSSAWRKAVAEGETAILLKRSTAKVLSYALYENDSSILLASSGDFKIDPAVVVPMLSAYRSATAEAFGAGIRNSEIEGGRWLTFIPGRQTTIIVLFSIQPARGQLDMLEDLHRDFETANASIISEGKGQEAAEQFVRLWTLGRGA
ncbi:MAG TPA: hypothetical protein VFF70_00720 [Anaerolineae bacterium]|nr:hypothetical protein [Anaerolineae bacterium]